MGWKSISRYETAEGNKFIRMEDALRTVGQLKGELPLNKGP